MIRSLFLPVIALVSTLSGAAFAQDLLPDRRAVIAEGMDLPGGDLRSLIGTTLDSCEQTCLADSACTAFTWNGRNGSCFPKSGAAAPTAYERAFSGLVRELPAGAQETARDRAAALPFLRRGLWETAKSQARALGRSHMAGGFGAEALREAAREAENSGDLPRAAALRGTAASVSDTAADWAEYARISLALSGRQDAPGAKIAALNATLNAWLRAPDTAATQHNLLSLMARTLEQNDMGREALKALRHAQSLTPRDDTATALDRLAGLYGMRIGTHRIESDLASPRLCAEFTEELVANGVDYTPYVQLPHAGMTVEPGGWRELCVAGLTHGERAAVTFREGLPAADGQVLAKSVTLTGYVRDRSPAVNFPGRGYVLPRGGQAMLPVNTVNATTLNLELYSLNDRNLIRSQQQGWLGERLDDWDRERFARDAGEKIWSGSATVGQETNRDVLTRLPLAEALAGRPAGIYALRAQVPGAADDYDNPSAWQWFVVTDLGVASWSGAGGVTVAVRALSDATPKAGVKVDLLTRSNRVAGSALTDADGVARFDAALTSGTGAAEPAMLLVSEGESDFAFLSLSEPEFDLTDRGVAGREAAPPIDLFVSTDRGAYRAGETVHATILARQGDARAITGLPLTARLRRPDGVEHSRQRISDQAGGFTLAAPLGGNPPRGSWRLDILADTEAAPLASRSFLVEDFLPERIDFTLNIPEGPVDASAVFPVEIEARYLFGAPGAELSGEAEVLLRNTDRLEAFPGFRFGMARESLASELIQIAAPPVTDAAGRAVLDVALDTERFRARPAEMELRVRLSEGSGRPVERRLNRPLLPEAALLGIRPQAEEVLPENAEAAFDLIATSGSLPASWRLERLETRYQWYRAGGDWSWEPVTSRTRVAEGDLTLSPTPQRVTAPTRWGEYELTVQAKDGSTASSHRFNSGWYVPADTARSPDLLELSLDKPAYRAGETAKLRIVPRAAGVAVVSVMTNRLVSLTSVEVREGENLIDLAVTDDWGAGVYVSASVIRPADAQAGRIPSRALGIAHAAVDPGDRKLAVSLDLPAEAKPRGPLDVAVKVGGVKPGETAYVTLAAVDVGILNLTAFKAPEPTAHYFGQRRLGVGLRDLYGRLIDGMNGAEGQVRSGGDSAAPGLQAKPPTEELVAYFEGPVAVGPDGVAKVSFNLPAFNGTVKVMAIAWSASGLGEANGDVLVRDPVVVSASLPRFLQPGDESRLRVDVIHAMGPVGRVSLDASAEGLTLGQGPSGLDLTEGARVTATIPLRAETEGTGKIDLRLTTPDGQSLSRPLQVAVVSNDPVGQLLTRLELKPGETATLDNALFAGFRPGTTHGLISSGMLARFDAPGLLSALDSYPWGCTEQLTSRLLPLLYFSQMADAIGLEGGATAKERIAQALPAILQNQTSEGGFGLWSAGGESNFWLDAYVTDLLSRARGLGHEVPDVAFRSALDNLRNRVNYAGDFEQGGEALAYALMVLAREGAAAIGDLRYYADVKAQAFATPLALAQLAAALSLYGDQPRADALFSQAARRALTPQPGEGEQVWRADFGSALRDAAGVLALALERGSTAVDTEALAQRLTARAGERALSTQEQAFILMASGGFAEAGVADSLTLNDAPVQGALLRRFDPAEGVMVVKNTGDRLAVLTVAAFGQLSGESRYDGNGYAITRRYYDLEGQEVQPTSVKSGTRLVAVLEVTPTGRGEARLMVTDPLPAGFEIDNPNLMRAGQISALDWLNTETNITHTEFREDRFMAALDRRDNRPFRLAYILRAVSPGSFHHAPATVEDMYRPTFRARTDSGRVTVTE
uniref:alpha-2-macroglobulin family protein n=1 Tax=Falsigemmobacter faecalis TaxID=2488730 RepID=UPI001F1B0CCE|nr:alpha-2-macroglobulin family protein [Falsigemmobacter faecalis]